jgi:hypothetical protein
LQIKTLKKMKLLKRIIELLSNPYVVSGTYNNRTLTIKWSNGKIVEYEGSGTVWCELPYMRRCSTNMESLLYQIYSYCRKWNGEYPNAHKDNKIV